MTPDVVLESLAEECHSDHVGLWEIVDAVHFDLGSTNPLETQALTLRLIRRLLSERSMLVGHPAPDGRHFISRDLPPDEAVSRIEREWSALGREPQNRGSGLVYQCRSASERTLAGNGAITRGVLSLDDGGNSWRYGSNWLSAGNHTRRPSP